MPGSSAYPGALDNFAAASPTNLADLDTTGRDHDARHDDVEAAMEAVQGELGINPAGDFATVAARIAAGGYAIASVTTGTANPYTPTTAQSGGLILINHASAGTVTIGTALALTAGERIDFVQYGAGQTTFSESSVTIRSTPTKKLRAQYSAASLLCIGTNEYLLTGDLSAT